MYDVRRNLRRLLQLASGTGGGMTAVPIPIPIVINDQTPRWAVLTIFVILAGGLVIVLAYVAAIWVGDWWSWRRRRYDYRRWPGKKWRRSGGRQWLR